MYPAIDGFIAINVYNDTSFQKLVEIFKVKGNLIA